MGLWEEWYEKAKSFFEADGTDSSTAIQKKCYYALLEVPRDATDDEIKRSYKKLALKWHPDKNPERKDECTAYFVLLQQAYEVLSDPQERAFYDKHRENIIHGSSPEEKKDTGINLYPFFQKCYRGFGDDQDSFFTVYRNLFDKLASEEFPYFDEDEEPPHIPSFGTAISDYDQVVGPFYDYWTSFSTLRSFAWLDRYDLRQADDRYTLKAMEKENKKLRDAGKKQRNDQIRNLVSYVRRRDPRVRLHREQLEERKQAEFNRVEMQQRKQIQNNLLKFQDQQMPSTLSEDHLDALEKIENDLDEQFGVLACSDDEEESNNFFCIVCEKKFKNAKSFANHERSKKHKDAVAKLKEFMVEDDHRLFEDDQSTNSEVEEEVRETKKGKRRKKNKERTKIEEIETIVPETTNDETVIAQESKEAGEVSKTTIQKKKKTQGKQKTSAPQPNLSTGPIAANCLVCDEEFASKSKLFAHINSTGHAALKENTKTAKRKK
ncbi:hypothetical protein M3Y96_00087000 [Aphelenchoides besseyi]|nr:hypothetical protein M3Y96_00087000 [Aphelenchoides besseyi]